MTHSAAGQPCCPKFDPTPWEGKMNVWEGKKFIKASIPVFFHIPFPPMVGRVMSKLWTAAQKAGAAPEQSEFLCLVTDPSAWRSEFYMAVTKDVPGFENVTFTGSYLSKVFDGPYNAVPKWIKELDSAVSAAGKQVGKYYFHYTTCPKCAKLYGHNYTVGFAEVM